MWQLRSIVIRGLYPPRGQEIGILPVRRIIPFLWSNRPGVIRKRATASDFIGTFARFGQIQAGRPYAILRHCAPRLWLRGEAEQ